MKKIRLDRYLANCGIGSRKDVKSLIQKRCVLVDGIPIKDSGYSVTPSESEVIVNGQKVLYKEFLYLMMNKPPGVISATTDKKHTTVIDLLPESWSHRNLFPVGRLDKDTEGLLILTDDGVLAHKLLSPKNHVPKTYYAIIDGEVTSRDVELFEYGIQLEDDFTTLPAKLSILESGKESKVNVTIYEGKFHQVKRMFEAVGKKVIYLKRISMGDLKLDESLAVGEVRELKDEEVILLKKSIE
jgi:16S rRNA pseudouridine516 synthase